MTRPFAFLKHQNFFNFSEYGQDVSPIYMNFVRHPVDKFISWHYYVRAPWYQVGPIKNVQKPKAAQRGPFLQLLQDEARNKTYLKTNLSVFELKLSVEDCVRMRYKGCVIWPNMSIHHSP